MRSRKPVPESTQKAMFGNLMSSGPREVEREAIGSTAGSIIIHAVLIAILIYATSSASGAPPPDTPMRVITLPRAPLPVIPPPTMDLPQQAASAPAPMGFPTIPMPDVVPPSIPVPQVGVSIRAEDFMGRGVADAPRDGDSTAKGSPEGSDAPFATLMSIPPKLRNVEEVQRAVSKNYPGILRDAGISGTTIMWFYIDETGRAVKHQVHRSSGYEALDDAAARVADVMRFQPARIQDRIIPVWVQVPVVFRIQ